MKNREYGIVEEVLDHLQLIWDNCKEYNKEGGYFELAEKMEKAFRKMIKNYLPSIVINYVQSNLFYHIYRTQSISHPTPSYYPAQTATSTLAPKHPPEPTQAPT